MNSHRKHKFASSPHPPANASGRNKLYFFGTQILNSSSELIDELIYFHVCISRNKLCNNWNADVFRLPAMMMIHVV